MQHSPVVKTIPIERATPKPLPNHLPPVPEFEPELLPSVLSVSALEISKTTQAPIDFIATGFLVAASSLVARHVGIRPKARDHWTVVPNLWGLVVGRPSAKKTPALSRALSPLDRLEDKASEEFSLAVQDHETTKQLHEHVAKANHSQIQKLLKKGDNQSKSDAAALIRETTESQPEPPACTRYIANDSTVEKLADLLQSNPAILVCRDELQGFFASLERTGQESARAFYLEAWNGDRPFKVDRIGRGSTRVPRACVSVLGGIQPGPLGSLLRELQHSSRANDGLLQRFQVAVWPDLSNTFELVDVEPGQDSWRQSVAVFERLAVLNAESVGAPPAEDGIPFLRFAPDAQQMYLRWLERLENRLRQEEMPECLEAHLGKYPSLVPSIALILHLLDENTGPVDLASTTKAIGWAKYLEEHAKRIYAPIVGADFVAARALAKKIQTGALPDRFRLRDVYRNGWTNLSTTDEARIAADVLEAYDWITPCQEDTGGRSAVSYLVNPLVYGESK